MFLFKKYKNVFSMSLLKSIKKNNVVFNVIAQKVYITKTMCFQYPCSKVLKTRHFLAMLRGSKYFLAGRSSQPGPGTFCPCSKYQKHNTLTVLEKSKSFLAGRSSQLGLSLARVNLPLLKSTKNTIHFNAFGRD